MLMLLGVTLMIISGSTILIGTNPVHGIPAKAEELKRAEREKRYQASLRG